VRLHESGGDANVGFDPVPVQPDGYVLAEAAAPGERCLVARVVIDDPHRRG